MARRLLVLLSMLAPMWMSGCVTFERAPAPLACDARLVGRWLPIANTAEEQASLTHDDFALVDSQCKATVSISQASDKSVRKVEVDARGFSLDGQHYLALGDADVTRLFTQSLPAGQEPPKALTGRAPSDSVTLVRYRIEADVFSMALVDYDTVEKLVKDKVLTASSADQFNYQFKGDDAYLREVLRKYPELFKSDPDKPMSLRRAPAEPAP